MLPIPSRGVQKAENRASLTWTCKKMSTLTSFQGFCVNVQFFVFKNTLKKIPKWILKWPFLVHPCVLSPNFHGI